MAASTTLIPVEKSPNVRINNNNIEQNLLYIKGHKQKCTVPHQCPSSFARSIWALHSVTHYQVQCKKGNQRSHPYYIHEAAQIK